MMSATVASPISILSSGQIDQKIRRMAYEIYENNFKEKHIVFAGICAQGKLLAIKLAKHLQNISSIETEVIEINLDKSHPFRENRGKSQPKINVTNKVIIMVDDVLHTGKTIAYGMKPFLNVKLKKIEVAVLIDRSHTAFPIKATYTGFALSTMLSEHVIVTLTGKEKGVYLN